MKILLYDMGSYIQKDLIYYLKQGGCTCRNILYKSTNRYHDTYFEKKFSQILSEDSYDCVMSTNFFPIVAQICYKNNIKYLSWSYDSPINLDDIEYLQYPTNYAFFFDNNDVLTLQKSGGIQIYHLPLAVNVERLNRITISNTEHQKYHCDISFIGQFYQNSLDNLMQILPDYTKGYIDALVETQMRIYGYNLLEEVIPEDFVSQINNILFAQNITEKLTRRGLIQSIEKKITRTERIVLLQMLGDMHQVHFYSSECPKELSHLYYGGSAYYFNEMPKIFRCSKINLCPTLKSIQSGIPLRSLDILGSKGSLLVNFQPELAEYFTDGVDVIMYDSMEDAVCKADYYLKHEKELLCILEKGYLKVKEQFSYVDRIQTMFKTAGLTF